MRLTLIILLLSISLYSQNTEVRHNNSSGGSFNCSDLSSCDIPNTEYKFNIEINPNCEIEFDFVSSDGSTDNSGTIDLSCINQTLTTTPITIYQEQYSARSSNGTTQLYGRNATITRTAQGRWNVTFATSHPDGVNYHSSLTSEESIANRDTPDVTVVEGSQTANGFQVQITTSGNGSSADSYVDAPWSFGVDAPIQVLQNVTISN